MQTLSDVINDFLTPYKSFVDHFGLMIGFDNLLSDHSFPIIELRIAFIQDCNNFNEEIAKKLNQYFKVSMPWIKEDHSCEGGLVTYSANLTKIIGNKAIKVNQLLVF